MVILVAGDLGDPYEQYELTSDTNISIYTLFLIESHMITNMCNSSSKVNCA